MITVHTPHGHAVLRLSPGKDVVLQKRLEKLPPGGYTLQQNGERIASAIISVVRILGQLVPRVQIVH